MATTRIMPLHIGKGRTESRAISDIIDYVANPQKTDNGKLITGYGCDSRTADAEFLLAKRQYIAATGRVRGADDVIAYHVRQSFKPGEITPEEANRLGVEFAKRFTKGNHAFVVCTHIDKSHVHNHIIWSSVSLEYDRKFRNFWGSTRAVRRLSDTICIENGLSIVEDPKPHGKSYNKWLGEQAKPSHREQLRVMIDRALEQKPADFDALLKLLTEMGCEVSRRGKAIRLKAPGWKNVARMDDKLGAGYSEAKIRAVLAGEKQHTPRKKSLVQPEPPKVNLLVDIQAKLQAGKGAGYARWAKVFNLKQMAQTVNFLTEHRLLDYAELAEKAAAATAHHNELSAQIKAAEKRIYCRLSNDDERDGESVSIENQKLLLQNYVRQRGWNEIDTYIDDGYSGTNFNRPGVKRLIEDAKAKRINVILVKDLSRFGRNYIEFGQYTDYLFPSLGCRFIALNNGIDTMSDNGSTDVMCFLNLFNEFYSRDTSKKVKAVKKACAESGKFMGTYPAYGYRRDPLDKHHLVIDEETAPIVRRIFAMRASGMGFHAIAAALNEEGIPSPGVLYYQRKGQSDPRRVNHKWADQTVKNMVRSEVYIGNMVQGKYGTLSYKSRKLVSKSEDQWIRVEGTHEAIISQELWDTVVSIDQKKVRKNTPADGCKSIFTGLVYCADCGFKMRNHIERFTYKDGRPGRYSSFLCGNYARSGKSACTVHTIYETVLYQLVLEDIREKARFAEVNPDSLIEQITRLKEKESHTRLFSYEQELKTARTRISELERLMQNLYEDKCTGAIPQTVFQTLMQKYEAERAEKAEVVPDLERKVKVHLENRVDADRWLDLIRRYTEFSELDETILFELVDRIEVGEAQKINGQRVCDIKVHYRYVGYVDTALAQEGRQDYDEAI